jgi:hypothetical protein
MSKLLFITFVMVVLLVGCKDEDKPVVKAAITKADASFETENKVLREQVNQLKKELEDAEQKNKESQNLIDSIQAPKDLLTTKYPKLPDFSIPSDFQQIEIKDSKGSYIVTDPSILNSFSNLLVIKSEATFGSGPQADIEPVQYILTTAKGTVRLNIVQHGIVSFNELYPDIFFEVDPNAYQLGKAFMNRPSYLSEETTIIKMVNSGLLKVGNENALYVFNAGRIRSVALAFFEAKKHDSTKPVRSFSPILNATFYYYGETIKMNLYNEKIQIIDDSGEIWYDTNIGGVEQIMSKISAS